MKKIVIILLALMVLPITASFALEADYIPMGISFPMITTDASSELIAPFAFVAPENITIKSVYVTETDGVTANATDSATFNLKDDGDTVQSYRTNLVSLVAMTPKAFTLDTDQVKIAKGSVLTVAITKQASGVALTTPVVQLNYTIGW